MLFSNEILGLGHLSKALALAEELARAGPDSTALVVTGCYGYSTSRLPPGVDLLKLPAAPVSADPRWEPGSVRQPAELALAPEQVLALRAELSLAAVRALAPDLVVVDHAPLGRGSDLLPALEWLRERGDTIVALGLRDFDDAADMRSVWTRGLVSKVARLYDLALIYGDYAADDPRVEALQAAGLPPHRTGLVGAPAVHDPAPDLGRGYLLVCAGGGVDGFSLLDAALDVLDAGPLGVPAVLVSGPMMPEGQFSELRRRARSAGARLERERADMGAVLAGARAVVAMAGYSTVAEILASGKPALLVPRRTPREEQLNRARYWAAAGRVEMLGSNGAPPAALRAAIERLLERPEGPGQPPTGAAEAAAILEEAVRAR